jgi:peptidoglycan/xylan/chitin deacetylase (PgdA/CDA1 family)
VKTITPIQNANSTQVAISVQNSSIIQAAMPKQDINSTQVAITVDDLPGIGDLPAGVSRIDVENQMLDAFKKHNLQNVYGMVVVGQVEGRRLGRKIINHWIAADNSVANHSYTHSDLAKVSSSFYIADIQNADDYLATIKQYGSFKYFRYPYLSEGDTLAKRRAVRSYLFNNGYQIAPVTVNFSDYEWNDPYARCLKQNNYQAIAWLKKTYINQALQALDNAHYSSNILFHHDIKNILLIHLGPFDAVMMDDLLTAYEKQGVQFISLPDALTDPAYQLNRNPNRAQTYTLSKRTESRDEMNDTPLTREQMSQELDHICRTPYTSQTQS